VHEKAEKAKTKKDLLTERKKRGLSWTYFNGPSDASSSSKRALIRADRQKDTDRAKEDESHGGKKKAARDKKGRSRHRYKKGSKDTKKKRIHSIEL